MSPVPRHEQLLAARASRPAGRIATRDSLLRAVTASVFSTVDYSGAEAHLAGLYGEDEAALGVLKAATSPATTGAAGWAQELATTALADFITSLVPVSAAAALFERATRLAFARRATLSLPVIATGATASWVAEGAPVPVTSADFGSVPLAPHKLALLAVLTTEVVKRTTAETAVRLAMSEAVTRALDSSLFDATAGTDERPAGLLAGVTSIAGTPGGNLAAVQADVTALVSAVANVASAIVLIAHPARAAALGIMAPGLTIPVLPSAFIAPTSVLAIAPSALAFATGTLDFDASKEATIHMESVPAELVTDAGVLAAPIRSAFQTDVVVLRGMLNISWALRAGSAAAAVEDVTW